MRKLKLSDSTGGLLVFLLGLLGFASGCKKADEYGTPYADYRVQGIVSLKTDNTPVAGATVKILLKYGGKYTDDSYFETVVTDAQGGFFIPPKSSGSSLQEVIALELSKTGAIKTDTVDVTSWNWVHDAYVGTVDAKVKPAEK